MSRYIMRNIMLKLSLLSVFFPIKYSISAEMKISIKSAHMSRYTTWNKYYM